MKVGRGKVVAKTPKAAPLVVPGGQWVTVAETNLRAGQRMLLELQVRMPKKSKAGEARIARLGWGTAGPGGIDDTGQNGIMPSTVAQRWRTPIVHQITGGGRVAYQIWLPNEERTYRVRVVAKKYRLS